MDVCKRCHSQAINPKSHGRDGISDLDLCDVCYWRKRAESKINYEVLDEASEHFDLNRYNQLRESMKGEE
jgi:hypothetical protein